jgi:hypothetical protein
MIGRTTAMGSNKDVRGSSRSSMYEYILAFTAACPLLEEAYSP